MNYIIGQGAVKSSFCQMVGQTTVVVFKLLTKVLVSVFNLVNMDVNSNQFLNHDVTYNQMLSVSTLSPPFSYVNFLIQWNLDLTNLYIIKSLV